MNYLTMVRYLLSYIIYIFGFFISVQWCIIFSGALFVNAFLNVVVNGAIFYLDAYI